MKCRAVVTIISTKIIGNLVVHFICRADTFWLSALPYFLIRKSSGIYDDAAVGNYIHARLLLSAEVVVHEIFRMERRVPRHSSAESSAGGFQKKSVVLIKSPYHVDYVKYLVVAVFCGDVLRHVGPDEIYGVVT